MRLYGIKVGYWVARANYSLVHSLILCKGLWKLDSECMARAYSDDLRRKFLEAYDAKEGSLRTLAKRFKVSKEWAFKISADRKRTGSPDRVPQARRGRAGLVDRPRIAASLTARPDMVLHELQAELEAATGQRTSLPHLWRVVRSLGFRLKKSRSTPPSATPMRTAAGVRSS